MMRPRSILAISLVLIAIGLGFRASSLLIFALSPAHQGDTSTTTLLVKRGILPSSLSKDLQEAGAITDSLKFYRLGVFLRKWEKLKAGEYELSPGMTPLEVFDRLSSGISVAHRLTFPEGSNMFQVGDALEKSALTTQSEFVFLCRDKELIQKLGFKDPLPPSLEGYLYPETYHFNRTMSTEDMIRTMVKGFNGTWTPAYTAKAKKAGMTRHEIITLASIVEKETGVPEERPRISSVFHNRLKKGMRIESDPTTIYGIWETFDGNLRKKHLSEKNSYNTYRLRGLPIGPIANPGREAILAALEPEESPYFYFVSRNDGTHVFSKTFEDHKRAVKNFQVNQAARKGKSWRDRLNK